MQYLTSQEKERNKELEEYFSEYVSKTLKSGLPVNLIEKYVSDRNALIVDMGCGNGFFLGQLWERGYKNLGGMDFADYLSEEVKKKLKFFQTADFSASTPSLDKNLSADCVTAWCVIPHLENPYNFVRGVSDLLKIGGLFIFSMPNIESYSHRKRFLKTGEMLNYSHKNDHITILTPNIVKKTFSKNFELIGEDYFIKDKAFRGIKGNIRKQLLKYFPSLSKKYGSKKIYIFKKISSGR